MRTITATNATIFFAAQGLSLVYKQRIRASLLDQVRDASSVLDPKAEQFEQLANRISSDYAKNQAKANEEIFELEQTEKEVRVPELDMDDVRATDPALTGPQWDALEAIFEPEALPEDLPHRDVLEEAGITSIEDLPDDLTEVGGIGDSYAEEIRAALA